MTGSSRLIFGMTVSRLLSPILDRGPHAPASDPCCLLYGITETVHSISRTFATSRIKCTVNHRNAFSALGVPNLRHAQLMPADHHPVHFVGTIGKAQVAHVLVH